MHEAGGEILSRAGLADEQHVAVGHRRSPHLATNLMHGGTVADERLRQVVGLLLRGRNQLPHAIEQRVTLARPVKVVGRTDAQRADGARLGFAEREHDDRNVRGRRRRTERDDFGVVDEQQRGIVRLESFRELA